MLLMRLGRSARFGAAALVLLAGPGAAQAKRLVPTVGVSVEQQAGGAQHRSGVGVQVGLWYALTPVFDVRAEAIGASFPWKDTGTNWPGGAPPADAFVTLSGVGSSVVARVADSLNIGPFLSVGVVALRGTGREGRDQRTAVARSVGVGASLGSRWLVEIQVLSKSRWADWDFAAARLSLARWLR